MSLRNKHRSELQIIVTIQRLNVIKLETDVRNTQIVHWIFQV